MPVALFAVTILFVLLSSSSNNNHVNSTPVPVAATTDRNIQVCGTELADVLQTACTTGYNYNYAVQEHTPGSNRKKRNIVHECCYQPCKWENILAYCDGSSQSIPSQVNTRDNKTAHDVNTIPSKKVPSISNNCTTTSSSHTSSSSSSSKNEIIPREKSSSNCIDESNYEPHKSKNNNRIKTSHNQVEHNYPSARQINNLSSRGDNRTGQLVLKELYYINKTPLVTDYGYHSSNTSRSS